MIAGVHAGLVKTCKTVITDIVISLIYCLISSLNDHETNLALQVLMSITSLLYKRQIKIILTPQLISN